MLISILTYEQLRRFIIFVICCVVSAVTPTQGFVTALVLAWAFNVWCGMRADGVLNIRCRNWSWRKFFHALGELFIFLLLLELIALVTYSCGDDQEGLYACKTITYISVWYEIENGLKNLCKSNPGNKALWIIYAFIRFEFTKVFKINDLIQLYEEHQLKQNNESEQDSDRED